jgi:Fe2+ transport system protein FeoA
MSGEKKIKEEDIIMSMELLSLISLIEGEEGVVHSISTGKGLTGRLAAMGIVPGMRIKILRNSGGPLVIIGNGTRVAIGRGQASKILLIKARAQQDGRGKAG